MEEASWHQKNLGGDRQRWALPHDGRRRDRDLIERKRDAIGKKHDGTTIVIVVNRVVVQPVVERGTDGERGQHQHERGRARREKAAEAQGGRGAEREENHNGGGKVAIMAESSRGAVF